MNPELKQPAEDLLSHQGVIAAALRARGVGEADGEISRQGVDDILAFLAQAVALDSRALFLDYIGWARVMLGRRQVPVEALVRHLGWLAEIVEEKLPGETGLRAAAMARSAAREVRGMPADLPSQLPKDTPLAPLAHQYLEALRRGERHLACRLILDAAAGGTEVKDIYLQVFQPTQHEIGRLWQTHRISVGLEHYCTATTQWIMSQLYPRILALKKKDATLVATCVAGDLHELGLRMVADFFEMDGWNTYYLGANTPHDAVVSTLIQRRADLLAISASMACHLSSVGALIRAVRKHPRCAGIAILVGGLPFIQDPELWRELGADGCAKDAQQAVTLGTQLWKRGQA
jgi:MerR family transcriptional regulator, light-induced transcriptional regulator